MIVEVVTRSKGRKIAIRRIKKTAQRILDLLNQGQAELSLVLVGNREMRALNAKYRKIDKPTDVLSFPSALFLPSGAKLLGDVIISVEQAARQAKERRKTLAQEVEGLLIHGILHLLGYDHERSKREAEIMRSMEKKISLALCEKEALRV
jgi:rRNA maturation RNase YbeY